MKAPSMAPVYAAAYLKMTEVARSCGYALALHGTMQRDLDLIAVPWTEEAVHPSVLVAAMAKAVGGWSPDYANTGEADPTPMPTKRPHGRLCWLIYWAGASCGFIDLSVMPLADAKETT